LKQLGVWFEGHRVGDLRQVAAGLSFQYASGWLESPQAFALALPLPLRDEAFGKPAANYFSNLLPEGPARQAVCARLGISYDNDYALLQALGRDCAGAISVTDETVPPKISGKRRPVTSVDLLGYLRSESVFAAAVGDDVRLSLAGAQDKLAVIKHEQELYLPLDATPSTHLLKFQNRRFAALPENEFFMLTLAAAIGLPTVQAQPFLVDGVMQLMIVRYDRQATGKVMRRLHQQDFCQALGVSQNNKYEAEGGATFADCLAVVRSTSVNALADTRELLRWLVFCLVIGNRDNHAKNLSLLRTQDGQWRLAPFYDLVCTAAYSTLSRKLAMSIGRSTDGGKLSRGSWEDEATRLDVAPRFLLRLVQEVCDDLRTALPGVVETVSGIIPKAASLEGPSRAIAKGLRSAQRSLLAAK